MSAATAAPLSIRGLVNAVVTCPGRDLSFFVRVFRDGEQYPFACLPVDGWELVKPARAKTLDKDGEDAPAKSGVVTLSILLPAELLEDLKPAAELPVKFAGRKEPAPPNSADAQGP